MKLITPHLVSRIGLAFVFFYAGIASFVSPEEWASYLPQFIESIMPIGVALWLHAIAEIVLAIAILFNIAPRLTYAVAALMLIGILVFLGINDVTFRDVGLALLAVSLWLKARDKKGIK